VDKAGVSAPFSLLLEASSPALAESNSSGSSFLQDFLGLKDVTFADGTSLATEGYGVSFGLGASLSAVRPRVALGRLWSVIALAGAWSPEWYEAGKTKEDAVAFRRQRRAVGEGHILEAEKVLEKGRSEELLSASAGDDASSRRENGGAYTRLVHR